MTILAHPDDAEIWAGGTIAQHTRAGNSAVICSLVGVADATRGWEAAEGATALGAELTLLDQRDRHLRAAPELVDTIARVIRDVRPSLLITHWEHDSHADHVQTNEAVRAAIAVAGNTQAYDAVLACDTYLGVGRSGMFEPDLYVDVTETWDQKLEAIRKHASQDPEQYVQTLERQCWLHGARAKVRYAEVFQFIPLYGRRGGAVRALGRS